MLPGAVPGVRVAPVATPQAFGAGLAGVGEDLGLAVFSKATLSANDSAVTAADRRLSQSETELHLRMLDLRGRDAAGAVDLLNDEWRKAVEGIEEQEIHNEQQRQAFRRAASQRYGALNKAAQTHAFQETRRWQNEETEAYIKTSQDNARLYAPTDLDKVEAEKARQRSAFVQWAERNGLGQWADEVPAGPGEPTPNPRSHDWIGLLSPGEVAEGRIADENAVRGPGMFVEGGQAAQRTFKETPEAKQRWAEILSQTNTEVVKGLLQKGLDQDAKAYYEANERDFTATDRDHIVPAITEGSTRGQALGISRFITAEQMTRTQALKALDGITDPKLHAAARDLVMQRFGDQEVADEKGAHTEADRRAEQIIGAQFDRKTALEHVTAIPNARVRKLVRDQVVQQFGDTEVATEADAKAGAARQAKTVVSGQMSRTDALAFIDGLEDPKLQKFTRELVLQHFQDQEAAEKRAHEQRFDSAKQLVDQAIGASPSREVNPRLVVGPDVWVGLTPAEQTSLNHIAREALHPTDRPNSDNKWFEFHSILTHEQVANLSPSDYRTKYRDHFSNEYRRAADTYYNQIRNAMARKDARDPELSATQTFKDQVEDAFRTSGLLGSVNEPLAKWSDEERTRYVKFERQAAAAIEQEELAKGKKLTPTEKQAVITNIKDEAIKQVWIKKGFFGFETQTPKIDLEENQKGQAVVPLDKIPDGELTELRHYITSKGKTVTTDKLRRAYAQRILRNRQAFEAIVNE
ncbi:MAG: hypothetical protein NTNFB02_10370 [Nitrospira sp.]